MAAEGLDPTFQKMLKIIQEFARDGWGREGHELDQCQFVILQSMLGVFFEEFREEAQHDFSFLCV